jgi:hypothetical protein
MSAMKRVLPLLFVASLLTVVASCVDSHNPASDEKTSKIDERLIGEWKIEEDNDNESLWKVTKNKDVKNALDLKMPDPNAPEHLPMFITTIKSKGYLSICISEKDPKAKDSGKEAKEREEEVGYNIIQYEFLDNDTLVVRAMASEAIIKAIRDKQLVGKIDKEDDEETPKITDTTEGIVRYLEAHADECFPEKMDKTEGKMVFKRQK